MSCRVQDFRASNDLAEQMKFLAPRPERIRHTASVRAKVLSIHLDTGRTDPPAKSRVLGPLPFKPKSLSDSGRLLPRDSTYTVCSKQPRLLLQDSEAPECALCHTLCSQGEPEFKGPRGKS